jgi:Na+/H+ antiporter NhaD/arsenite permease-like protein
VQDDRMLIAWLIAIVFIVGYLFISLEHEMKINKAGVAIFTAAAAWALYIGSGPTVERVALLLHYLEDIAQVVFFVLAAMVIVELIDAHNGFAAITDRIRLRSKRTLMWALVFIAFFLSAVLDNLTTTIVMLTVLKRLVPAGKERWLYGAVLVIAANSGGAWSPIGDVTTTMLWIGGQISTFGVVSGLFVPSLVSVVIPTLVASYLVKGKVQPQQASQRTKAHYTGLVLGLGVACLVAVPFWKIVVGLPPFMGMLMGLAIMWVVTDRIHSKGDNRGHLMVTEALRRVDASVALFFLGILLAVTSLDAVGLLELLAQGLNRIVSSLPALAAILGAISAVVDNVPLTAATMHMYDLTQFPIDHELWLLIAFAVGTGGSMLLIGSAAGVALMGIEKVNFWWYLRTITWIAALGYLAGLGWFVGARWLFGS